MSTNKIFSVNRKDFLKYAFFFTSFNFLPKSLISFENNIATPVIRNDLEVSQASNYLNRNPIELLNFAHVTDVHIVMKVIPDIGDKKIKRAYNFKRKIGIVKKSINRVAHIGHVIILQETNA